MADMSDEQKQRVHAAFSGVLANVSVNITDGLYRNFRAFAEALRDVKPKNAREARELAAFIKDVERDAERLITKGST